MNRGPNKYLRLQQEGVLHILGPRIASDSIQFDAYFDTIVRSHAWLWGVGGTTAFSRLLVKGQQDSTKSLPLLLSVATT